MSKIPTYGIYNPSVNTQSQVAQFPFNYSFNQPSTYWWKPSDVRDGEMWGYGSQARPVVLPEITVTYNKGKHNSYSNNKTTFHKVEAPFGTIADRIGQLFPAVRQVLDTYRHHSGIQTNADFSDSYLENLSQLGQVAYRQYVRNNGYPKEGVKFSLPLTPKVYREINPSHRYADFNDVQGMLNAAVGGNRQVEYTDGGMSGTAVVRDGRVYWNPTDEACWDFDSGQEKKLLKNIKEGSIGSALRYILGNYQRLNDALKTSLKQDLYIYFPSDTITVNPARYDNVPKIKQSRFLKKE